MIDKQFGEAFKKARCKKGIKITSFKEIGLSKTALSRFERGEQSLDVDRFYYGLKLMDITFYEFEHTYLGKGLGGFEKQYIELYQAAS
ncbi:helix-turn-helix domain-containing protein [Lactococcus sp.]|uniref:helix-turn-helix domain-containing protein n=1 Tax=Lactococcus sp. TaxID=44273 RepID=UPI0035B001CE